MRCAACLHPACTVGPSPLISLTAQGPDRQQTAPAAPGPGWGGVLCPGRRPVPPPLAPPAPPDLPPTIPIVLCVTSLPLGPASLGGRPVARGREAAPLGLESAPPGGEVLVQPAALPVCGLLGPGLGLLMQALLQLLGRDGCLPPAPQRGPCTPQRGQSCLVLSVLPSLTC